MKYKGPKSFKKCCKGCFFKEGVKCTSFYFPEAEDGSLVCINHTSVDAIKKYSEVSKHLRHCLDFEKRIIYKDDRRVEEHKKEIESIKRRIETWESIFL